MPIIRSAIKKVRIDERRHAVNLARQSRLRTLLKKAKTEASFEAVSEAYAALDKAVKVNMVHRNYANRKKSQLARLAKPTKLNQTAAKPAPKLVSEPVAKTTAKPVAKATKTISKK